MVDRQTIIIQIVSSVIASGLALSAYNNIANDFFYKPIISINILPHGTDDAYVIVKNDGTKPATNLLLTLQSPSILENYSVFYTDNATVTNFSKPMFPNALQIHVPRFVQGDGSEIDIVLIGNKADRSSSEYIADKYIAYATYDQGSIKQGVRNPLPPTDQILSFLYSYWIPIVLIAGAIIALLVAWNARRIRLRLIRIQQENLEEAMAESQESIEKTKDLQKETHGHQNEILALDSKMKKSDVKQLLDTMITVRRSIKENILSKEYWWDFDMLIDKKTFDKYLLDSSNIKASDYVLFDDFWNVLSSRNSYVKTGQINENQLKKYNNESLNLINQILANIDWIKIATASNHLAGE